MEADCSVIEVEHSILGSRFIPAPESFIEESKSGWGELSRDRWRRDKLDVIDQCRLLVHRLFLSPGGAKSVIFSGITPRSGCTSVVFSTAETMAVSTSGSVCVVDANAYSPYLNNLFDLSSAKGLSDALMEDRPATEYAQRLDESNLWVLPYGRQPIIDTEKKGRCFWMRNALTQVASRFDYVLVDTPPASRHSDAITLGPAVGGIALVMEAGKTRRDIAARTTSALRKAGVRILGVVLTGQQAG
jgi:Mrp family chromosome partitioning ATPase